MGTYTLELQGSLENPPVGVGPRIVTGQIVLGTVSEAVHAGSLGLRTINTFAAIPAPGTMFHVAVNAPGSIGYGGNYASVTFSRMQMTGTMAMKAITTGSKTFRFIAEGE